MPGPTPQNLMRSKDPACRPSTGHCAPLANRLIGVLQGCLRTHTLYNKHLAWHNELDKLSPAA